MIRTTYLAIILLILNHTSAAGQNDSIHNAKSQFPLRKLTLEPAIGINPMPMSDLVVSNLVQFNVKKHFNIVSRSAVTFNTAFERDFNYIKTDYNYSLSQTFGIGTSFYLKHSAHTFSLMGGIKYIATKETLNNPDFEKISVASHTNSPDLGLMYNLKIGKQKYFFSYRMYIPLYPYPFKTYDFTAIDATLAGISLEFGVGVRLK